MSEQTNPTANEEETTSVAESSTTETSVADETTSNDSANGPSEQPTQERTQQPATPSLRDEARPSSASRASSYDEDDEYDDDYDDDEYDDYDEEDEDLYVDGPAQYVQRERGGRGRRIGSDVRIADIDYKNVTLLSRFLDRRGRILSRRRTRVSAKVQRRIVKAIKRARHLALLPYTGEHTRIVRKRR